MHLPTRYQVLYVDEDFPPSDKSLGPFLSDHVTWRRPHDFPDAFAPSFTTPTSSKISTSGGAGAEPYPDDVRPCPFAADNSFPCAMAALAEIPYLVRSALCCQDGHRSDGGHRNPRCVRRGSSRAIRDRIDGGGGGSVLGGEHALGGNHREDRDQKRGMRDAQQRRASNSTRAAGMAKKNAKRFAERAAAGIFVARLCVDGVWVEYVMDDYFPCYPGHGSERNDIVESSGGEDSLIDRCSGRGGPCLSRAQGPTLWVSMLEKAYARAKGSYSAVLGGCREFVDPSGTQQGEEHGKQAADRIVSGVDRNTQGAQSAFLPGGIVARPAEVLSVFTGTPFLQIPLTRLGNRGSTAGVHEAVIPGVGSQDDRAARRASAEELWGSVARLDSTEIAIASCVIL